MSTTARRPTLCVVAGPNGSGKTTTTTQLLANEWAADSLYINPDNIAQEVFGDWNSPEAVIKAAQLATEKRYEFVDRAYIYDNSVDDHLPQLLCRSVEGKVVKQYADVLPEWVARII